MTGTHAEPTAGQRTREPGGGTSAGAAARRRLIADLPVTDRRLELAGFSTAVLAGGDGPPVVLLHGPMANATHWLRVIPELAIRHRVIAPDLPGHGATTVSSGTLDVDRVIEWLGALIEETCGTPPTLVGHLLGGAIAARFAGDHSGQLSRLALIDTFGLQPFQPAPAFGLALMQFMTEPTEQKHTALWRHCAFDLDTLRRGMAHGWQPFEAYNLDRARTPSVQAAVATLMDCIGNPAIPPDILARIAVPTTLIWGRHDSATPLSVAEAASARLGWPLHVIDNCNDDPPVEQPAMLVRALEAAPSDAA